MSPMGTLICSGLLNARSQDCRKSLNWDHGGGRGMLALEGREVLFLPCLSFGRCAGDGLHV